MVSLLLKENSKKEKVQITNAGMWICQSSNRIVSILIHLIVANNYGFPFYFKDSNVTISPQA